MKSEDETDAELEEGEGVENADINTKSDETQIKCTLTRSTQSL